MGQIFLIAVLLGICCPLLHGQACAKYEQAMRLGQSYLDRSNFDGALIEFQAAQIAARECGLDAAARQAPAEGLQAAFNGLEQESRDALRAKDEAERAEALARRRAMEAEAAQDTAARALARLDSLNEKNERLINALSFYDGRYALAQRQSFGINRYGFIDKDGRIRIAFIYEEARPFDDNGLARVKRDNAYYLIDTLGREYRLAESLWELSSMTEALDLRTQGHTAFPDTITAFPGLKILLLNGKSWQQIPASIGRLQQLEVLSLSNNALTAAGLPPEMAQLQQLRLLILNYNRLDMLPDWIGRLNGLRRLELRGCGLKALPAALTRLDKLRYLDLGNNQLDNLPEDFGQLAGLQYLDLQRNNISRLPPSFSRLDSLEYLDLWQNRLQALPADLGRLSKLKHLNIRENALPELPAAIGELGQLRQLNLAYNQLTGLPTALGKLASLQELDLSGNPLRELPAGIGDLSGLQMLKLTGIRGLALPSTLSQLRQLQDLNLAGLGLESFPAEIWQLHKLERLDLGANYLPGLPATFGRLQQLRHLHLNQNKLSEFPPAILELGRLETLDLSNNQLRVLPPATGRLGQLKKLFLNDNQLVVLPPALLQLSKLKEVRLYGNPLPQLPPEVVTSGRAAILEALREAWEDKARALGNDPAPETPARRQAAYADLTRLLQALAAISETNGDHVAAQYYYNRLAEYLLLSGKFAEAEAALGNGLKSAADDHLTIRFLLPAQLFQGRYEAARQGYLRWKDEAFDFTSRPFSQIFLEDLDRCEAAGVIPAALQEQVAGIRRLLRQ